MLNQHWDLETSNAQKDWLMQFATLFHLYQPCLKSGNETDLNYTYIAPTFGNEDGRSPVYGFSSESDP